ncbi:hypothetical protein B0H14DRAFT_2564461 [Mycena olivaceomarginata]|nr:hypothetical protein B0H14DRAFT_2564461 [Mycena olivaceomarginata]
MTVFLICPYFLARVIFGWPFRVYLNLSYGQLGFVGGADGTDNYQSRSLNEATWKKALAELRSILYLTSLLTVAQTGVSSHYVYSVLALSRGDPKIFAKTAVVNDRNTHVHWLHGSLSAVVLCLVTGMMKIRHPTKHQCRRIYQLKKQNLWAHIVSGLIAILAMLQAVTVCITSAKFARTMRTIAELVKEKELATFWLITTKEYSDG